MTFALLLACGPGAPASIDAVDSMLLYDRRDVVQDVGVRDARGRLLPDAHATPVSTSDDAVVALRPGGWACASSGQAVVTLEVDAVQHAVHVTCLLVGRIAVEPEQVRAVLPSVEGVSDPVEVPALSVVVTDDAGQPLDVPVRVQSLDDRVVRVGPEDVLELRAFGATTVQVVAGELTVSVPVVVGQTWREESVSIPEGRREQWTLAPGRWHWTASADAAVIASAGPCRDVGVKLDRTCDLPDGGELVVESRIPGLRRVALRIERLPEGQ